MLWSLPFTLTEQDGVARLNYPFTGGLPLPVGTLRADARLVVRDDRDEVHPVQTEVRAAWPDGSVRWLGLTFLADVGRLEKRRFVLAEVDDPAPEAAAELSLAGVCDGAPILLLASSAMVGSRVSLTDTAGRAWIAAAGETTVVRRGAIHSTVCTRGRLTSPDDSAQVVYWEAWSDLFAAAPFVQTRFVYWAGAGEASFIPQPPQPPPILAFSDLTIQIQVQPRAGVRYAVSRGQWGSARVGVCETDVPVCQLQADAQAWRTVDRDGQMLENGVDKSEGFIGIQADDDSGLGVGLAEIWQSHPKALRADKVTLEVSIWPRESGRPLHLHPGAGRAHTILVTRYDNPECLRELVNGMASPMLPEIGVEAVNRAAIMPPLLSPHQTPVPFAEWQAEAMFPGFLSFSNVANMGPWGTGEWDWGDVRAPLYDDRNNPIGYGEGGIWANGEAQLGYGMLLQYLRTGRIDCLTMGLACARHKAGVDTIHDAAAAWQIGAQHIHSLAHATGPCLPCHTWTSELALGWLMTGDHWLRSVLAASIEHLLLVNGEDQTDYRERAGGWLLIALCAGYEGLGDPRCLQTASRVMAGLSRWLQEDGGSMWIPPSRQVHTPVHTFIAMTGIADYWRLTGDPAAQEALLAGGELLLGKGRDAAGFFITADAPGYRIYSQVPRWPLAQCLPVMNDLYRLTGDRDWLVIGMQQCRLLWKLTAAEAGWRDEPNWPHEGSVYYAYAFGFLESARQAGLLTDIDAAV